VAWTGQLCDKGCCKQKSVKSPYPIRGICACVIQGSGALKSAQKTVTSKTFPLQLLSSIVLFSSPEQKTLPMFSAPELPLLGLDLIG
jgi:hypothetical protein